MSILVGPGFECLIWPGLPKVHKMGVVVLKWDLVGFVYLGILPSNNFLKRKSIFFSSPIFKDQNGVVFRRYERKE